MKKLGYFALLLLLSGAGCFAQTETSEGPQGGGMTEENLVDVEDEDLMLEDEEMEEQETSMPADESVMEEPEAGPQVVSMVSGNYFFSPASVTVQAGAEVRIDFEQNTGVHTFVIDEIGLNVPINAGEGTTFTAPSTPGTYNFYCSIGNHRALGMEGVLIVQ